MNLTVKRQPSKNGTTLGELFIDGSFECYTLEDEIREIPGKPVLEWKVHGKTAIPSGTYNVIISASPHFKRNLPEILSVPGYVGVRIHPGNYAIDTEGCLLVGNHQDPVACCVLNSRDAFDSLYPKIELAISNKEPVMITYLNP